MESLYLALSLQRVEIMSLLQVRHPIVSHKLDPITMTPITPTLFNCKAAHNRVSAPLASETNRT